ncbi:histone H3-like centromeric protein hH3v isoform X2 [Odontomachus brunneus]|uniref:histone H3-like centromeric protein hH3v isoform X2 n=1 Tax=Odontomachus brunneus TaxID=486640 RepID=UPI0013F23B22|nr:histone H3-like centromeric protein hH3v isoform X2 [Odontomachus brunneus]
MVRRKPTPRSHSSRERSSVRKQKDTEVIIYKKKKRFHVLREIRHLRHTTNLLIPKLPFARLVREIMFEIFPRQVINSISHGTKSVTSIRPRSPARGYGDVHRTILRGRSTAGVTCKTCDSNAKRHDSNA